MNFKKTPKNTFLLLRKVPWELPKIKIKIKDKMGIQIAITASCPWRVTVCGQKSEVWRRR